MPAPSPSPGRVRQLVLIVLLVALGGCENEATGGRAALVAPAWQGQAAAQALAFARAQVGRPYCWGGTGPRCFDCSGLTMTAWGRAGVRLPRTADAIADTLPEVPLYAVQPGDILWWPGHVGIYAGNGWSVEALNARSGVVMRRPPKPRRAFRPLG